MDACRCPTTSMWKVKVFGHLADLLLDDRLHSLHCLLDDDDVLNVCVHNLLRLFLRLNDGHVNDPRSE